MMAKGNKLFLVLLVALAGLFVLPHGAYAATTITVELRDANGNLFPRAAGETMYVVCSDHISMTPPQGAPSVGESSVTLTVSADTTYFCSAYDREGYKRSLLPAVSVPSGGSQTLTETYTPLTQNVHVNLVDSNGTPFLAPQAHLSCSSSYGGFYDDFSPNSSSHSMPIDTDQYSCSISNVPGYMAIPQSFSVSFVPGVDQNISFTMHEVSSSLTVNFFDGNGNPVMGSLNESIAISCATDLDGERIEFGGYASNGQGSATFDVLGGRTYDCTVNPIYQLQLGEFSVTVGSSENKTFNFTFGAKTAPLKIKAIDANGAPISVPVGQGAVPVSCEDTNTWGRSASGEIPEGASEVTILTTPGRYYCYLESFPGYMIRSVARTVFTKNDITAEYNFVGDAADSVLTINVLDGNGAPLPAPAGYDNWIPSVMCEGSKGSYNKTLTPGDTSASFSVIGGGSYRCSVSGFYGYLDASTTVVVDPAQSKTIAVTKPSLSADVTVSIVDEVNNPVLSMQNMQAYLISATQSSLNFFENISSGFSSAVIKALGGVTYDAHMYVGSGIPISVASVTAPVSGATSVQVHTLPTDATLTLRLVDSNGVVVSGLRNLQAQLGAYSSSIDHSLAVSFVNGIATAKLMGGVTYMSFYNSTGAGASVENLYTAGSYRYFFPEQMSRFTVPSGQSVTQDITVYRADATLTVNSPLGRGFIGVVPRSISARNAIGASFRGGATSVTVPIPAGSHYVVYDAGGGTVPERREINVSPGGNATVSFNPPVADLNVGVTTSAPGGAGGVVRCNAYHDDFSVYNTEGVIEGSPAYVPLTSTYRDWTIACQGWNETTNKIYGGKVAYTVPDPLPQLALDSVNVALSENGEIFSSTATGSSNSDIVVPVQGASALVAPAGTFDANKLLTLQVTNKASAPETKDVVPTTVLKLSAKDSNNGDVAANSGVELQLALGASQEVYSYSNSTGYSRFNKTAAAKAAGVRVSALNSYTIQVPKDVFNQGVVVITGSALSDPGATPTPDIPSKVPPKPRNLKLASKRTGRSQSIVATWSKSSEEVSSYSVYLIHAGKVVKKITVPASRRPKAVFSGLRAGTFLVRVRARNARGGSAAVLREISLN